MQRDVAEVLLGDEGDRDVVDVQLVLANQVQEQVERPLEGIELDLIGVRRRFEVGVFVHDRATGFGLRATGFGNTPQYLSFIASLTRSIVACAMTRARREPSTRISRMWSGLAMTARRRSRTGSSAAFSAAASFVFTSTSPTFPAR